MLLLLLLLALFVIDLIEQMALNLQDLKMTDHERKQWLEIKNRSSRMGYTEKMANLNCCKKWSVQLCREDVETSSVGQR